MLELYVEIIMNNTNKTLILILQGLSLGILSIIFPPIVFFIPHRFLTYAYEDSIIKSILFFGISCFGVGLLSPMIGVFLFTICAPLILVLHYMMTTKTLSHYAIIAGGAITFVAGIMIMYAMGINGDTLLSKESVDGYIQNAELILKNAGLNNTQFNDMKANLILNFRNSVRLMPSIMVIIAMMLSYITYTKSARTIITNGRAVQFTTPFIWFRMPRSYTQIMVIVILFLECILKDMDTLSFNIKAILLFSMFIQGVSVVKFYMNKIKMGRFIQSVIILFMVVFTWTQIIAVSIGFIDSLLNVRRLPKFNE